MKKLMITCVAALAALAANALVDDATAERNARERLAKMTLEEKCSLMAGSGTMTLPAIPRVGIMREWKFSDNSQTVRQDIDRWSFEHAGKAEEQYATVLPTLSALASTWNVELARAHGEALGEEARGRGVDQMLGPGVNIMRTPLCGRNWEYMTEDPLLASKMVVPLIKGLQSKDVVATVKHFAFNDQEWNRNSVDTYVDDETAAKIYLPAFKAAVEEAGTLGLMTAYNKFRGEWCSENAYLQKTLLRDTWGYKGIIVTDWGGQHTCAKAVNAGCGIEMNRGSAIRHLVEPRTGRMPLLDAVKAGEVTESTVDEAVYHLLYVMEKVNFFDESKRTKGAHDTEAHREVARRIGEEAIVLLKNEASELPLEKKAMRRVLLVGKLADTEACRLGWSAEGNPPYEMTALKGIKEYLGEGVEVIAAPLVGSDTTIGAQHPLEKEIASFDPTAKDAGMSVRAWHAVYWTNTREEGEIAGENYPRKLDIDWQGQPPVAGVEAWNFSMRAEAKVQPSETGVYTIALHSSIGSGFKVAVDGATVIDCWAAGRREGSAKVAMEAGKEYSVTVDYHSGTAESICRFGWVPPSLMAMSVDEVKAEAAKADAVFVFTGTEVGHGQALECEGGDRPNMKLAEGHDEAIKEILSWGLKNTIIVVRSGSPLELPWADDAKELVWSPYLGQEYGRSLARVLFGEVNPSGRLPCTWPKRYEDTGVAQCGTYNDVMVEYKEGSLVGYRWFDAKGIEPRFRFGYGLSYTTFVCEKLGEDGRRVKVTNTGSRAGKTVVENFEGGELKGFVKTRLLKPGESEVVELQ